nr:PREDICTED: mdm2-binding protein [Latimeria chalumnae]|eukprot:XP_014343028.1 PREDICTED: mdm2-binding protein [Latimeria chalumnae]
MDRYVLLLTWSRTEELSGEGLKAANNIYNQLKETCSYPAKQNVISFPACSLMGASAPRKWFFAIQALHGSSQFCSSEWEEIGSGAQSNSNEESAQTAVEEFLSAIQSFEDEDGDSRESLSEAELFEDCAECLHQLLDKLPPPGRSLVDVILHASDSDSPKLKECLPVIGALKRSKEWHSADITIATKDGESWKKIAEYLSAKVTEVDDLTKVMDPNELWRGMIQIREKKGWRANQLIGLMAPLGENPSAFLVVIFVPCALFSLVVAMVFHYYRPVLDFVQLVALGDLPAYFHSSIEFELGLSRSDIKGKTKLLLDQLSSLKGKAGALFHLPCSVSNVIPPATQFCTRKWKECMAKNPKSITVPDVEIKGENCSYYLLVQGTEYGGCKASLLHSANQINGAVALAVINERLKENKSELEAGLDVAAVLRSMVCLHGEQLVQRERKLACVQTLALKECLRSRVMAKKHSLIPINDLGALLTLAREQYLKLYDQDFPKPILHGKVHKDNAIQEYAGQFLTRLNPSEWPDRSVLQNYENLQRTKPKIRTGAVLVGSTESLLGPKDGPKAPPALLDAKELLKYFTSEGQPTADLQPLLVQRGESGFLLTRNLTPRKVRHLPFKEAATCHYHGLEYCLDDRKALERDMAFAKLQSRLVRYETQTTCSRECCPIPYALSPLPSPAVLSEPGSIPDGETLQNELKTETGRFKRRSRDLDGGCSSKRLAKSESTESLLSQANGSGIHHHSASTRSDRPQRSISASASTKHSSGQSRKLAAKTGQESQRGTQKSETQQQKKESRSQKHTRMLKEIVAKTLKNHGIAEDHPCFAACSQRLFEISKFYLKDLKTSRGLHEEMKKAASSNVKQVIDWVLEKAKKK